MCAARRSRWAARPGLAVVVPLLGLAALASGCGGGSSRTASGAASATTVAPGGTSGPAAATRARFTSCLEAHGVPASEATRGFGFRRPVTTSPGGSSSSTASSTPPTTSAAYAAAFQACRADLPARFGAGLQNTAAGRAYLQCLQLHGVTLPTTAPSTGGGGSPSGSSPAPGFRSLASDPAFQAARTACAALAPNRDQGTSGAAGTGPTTTAG